MSFINAIRHFRTITKHKILVMKYCFSVGLFRQGLLHDLSKYSPEEFLTGVRYYQGTRSPNAAEKDVKGYSAAWLHHKGRNKHHFEYWIDYAPRSGPEEGWRLAGNRMPLCYVIEMVLDRIAASRVYKGADYTDACAWEYYKLGRDVIGIHPQTRHQLEYLLLMLKEQGEEKTFDYIRALLWREKLRWLQRQKEKLFARKGSI